MPRVSAATVFVCTTCRRPIEGSQNGQEQYDEPGKALAQRLEELTSNDADLTIVPVECLAVCTRPCTIAFSSKDKWTYIIGDIDTDEHAVDIADAARAFAASKDGIVPWRERPKIFRKGVVARVPPKSFRLTEADK